MDEYAQDRAEINAQNAEQEAERASELPFTVGEWPLQRPTGQFYVQTPTGNTGRWFYTREAAQAVADRLNGAAVGGPEHDPIYAPMMED